MTVVYRQKELDKALADGCERITLCAGIFTVRNASSVIFDRIGPVKVNVDYTVEQARKQGLEFINIYPTFKNAYALAKRETMLPVAVGSSYGSYGSYSSSYGSFGSGSGTHYHEYEYEYAASWKTSAVSSYVSSYSYSNSYVGSMSSSYKGDNTVRIFGYGINLI